MPEPYDPTVARLRETYQLGFPLNRQEETGREFDRAIAKIKADAVREAAPTREAVMDRLNSEGAYCGNCEYEPGWRECRECRQTLGAYADAMGEIFGAETP